MNKENMMKLAGKIAIVAVGVIAGSLTLQAGQRYFAKSNFSKPLDVVVEE